MSTNERIYWDRWQERNGTWTAALFDARGDLVQKREGLPSKKAAEERIGSWLADRAAEETE